MKTGKSAAAAWMLYLLMVIMLFLFLAPFGIVFFNSLKPLNEILLDPLSLPDQLHFENFTHHPKTLGQPVPPPSRIRVLSGIPHRHVLLLDITPP